MTEQESKKLFDFYSDAPLSCLPHTLKGVPVEDLYQAFKARLKAEATCNCWAKEAR